MVQPMSSTGTTADAPVMPDARIHYEQLPPERPIAEYRVPAIQPAPRKGTPGASS
jgi:hypothetical protein